MKNLIKITKIVDDNRGRKVTKFFANGILVATNKTYMEYFCTIDKQGRRSNIRDKWKLAKESEWVDNGLIQLLGEGVRAEIDLGKPRGEGKPIFESEYPDLMWGYSGRLLTGKKIKECIEQYRNLSTGSTVK
jgi:hypothetical protein